MCTPVGSRGARRHSSLAQRCTDLYLPRKTRAAPHEVQALIQSHLQTVDKFKVRRHLGEVNQAKAPSLTAVSNGMHQDWVREDLNQHKISVSRRCLHKDGEPHIHLLGV
jgi:hypothetical protein